MTRTTSKKRSSRKKPAPSASAARLAPGTSSRKGVSRKRLSTKKASAKRTSGKKSSGKKGAAKKAAQVEARNKPLSALTDEALRNYFASLNGHRPADLYQLVIGEVEKPLLNAVLRYANGNQCVAATILGINRGTLRKKLRAHNLLDG